MDTQTDTCSRSLGERGAARSPKPNEVAFDVRRDIPHGVVAHRVNSGLAAIQAA